MPSWLLAIVKATLQFGKLWYDAKQAEIARWDAKVAAGKLESIKETKTIEASIKEVKPPVRVHTANAWNRGVECIPPHRTILPFLFLALFFIDYFRTVPIA